MRPAMKKLLILILFALTTASAWSKEAAPLAQDEAIEKHMVAITEELRCLVCQNESLAGSHAELANDLRDEIRKMLKEGKTDKEILDFMTDRYGDFVRYRPPVKPTTYLLWFGPFALMLAGFFGLTAYLRSRGKRVTEPSALSADEQKQADDLLSQLAPEQDAKQGKAR